MKCDYKYGMNYGFKNETVIRQTFLSMGVRPTRNKSGPALWKVFISDVNPSKIQKSTLTIQQYTIQ